MLWVPGYNVKEVRDDLCLFSFARSGFEFGIVIFCNLCLVTSSSALQSFVAWSLAFLFILVLFR